MQPQEKRPIVGLRAFGGFAKRNANFGDQIGAALEDRGIIGGLVASKRVAEWAYGQTEAVGPRAIPLSWEQQASRRTFADSSLTIELRR
jgi:hypothetical protein